MPSIDEILASSPLAGLGRVSASGGDRQVALVRLAESFTDLDRAPAASLVILSRLASAEVSDYRLDIAARADIALISIPAGTEAAGLVQAIIREIGGGADLALGRAEQGLAAVLAAESAGGGVEELRAAVAGALGTRVEFRPWSDGRTAAGDGATASAAAHAAADGGLGAASVRPNAANVGPNAANAGPNAAKVGPNAADGEPVGPPGADQLAALPAGDRPAAPLAGVPLVADPSGARDTALGSAADGEVSAR